MLTKFKNNFRILPVFIFLAVLTLSIRVNNVFDLLKNADSRSFSISQSKAWAEEEASGTPLNSARFLNSPNAGKTRAATAKRPTAPLPSLKS